MESTNLEVAVIEETVTKVTDGQRRELIDLQLAFVGGGNGEVSPY